MGLSSIFSTQEYNVYDYKPRYYDPEKEKRKQRLRELRVENGKSPDIGLETTGENKPGSIVRGGFRKRMSDRKYSERSSIIRFLVIFSILLFFTFLILFVDLTPLISYFSS